MKIIAPSFVIALFCLGAHCSFSQMEVDKSISLTGGAGNSTIGGLVDAPTLGTDATNKDYVDAAVSAGGGGSLPTMISDESSTTMDYGSAMRYCRNLTEATFSDWHLPTFEEISYIYSKGGTSVSNENSSNYVWTVAQGVSNGYSNRIQSIRFSDGVNSYNSGSALIYVRCVR